MGYFSNGCQGMDYEDKYCAKCVHCPRYEKGINCAVLEAHLIYNYDECNNKNSILHILIPRDKQGYNEKCRMFHPVREASRE